MPSTRTRESIPWDDIEKQVSQAIEDCNGSLRFVKVANISRHSLEHQDEYPAFVGCTSKTTQFRITMTLNKFAWERYTTRGNRATVFINPWVEA